MCWRDDLSYNDRRVLFEEDLRRARQRREQRDLSANYAGAGDLDVSLAMNPDVTSDFPPNEDHTMSVRKGGKKSGREQPAKKGTKPPASPNPPIPGAGPGGTTGVGTVRPESQPPQKGK